MKIELGKEYKTIMNHQAVVLYIQPEHIIDDFPIVGYVEIDRVKIGVSWSMIGLAGEDMIYDLIGDFE